jgi:hypothetical protein
MHHPCENHHLQQDGGKSRCSVQGGRGDRAEGGSRRWIRRRPCEEVEPAGQAAAQGEGAGASCVLRRFKLQNSPSSERTTRGASEGGREPPRRRWARGRRSWPHSPPPPSSPAGARRPAHAPLAPRRACARSPTSCPRPLTRTALLAHRAHLPLRQMHSRREVIHFYLSSLLTRQMLGLLEMNPW